MPAARTAQQMVTLVRGRINRFSPEPFRDGFGTDPVTTNCISILDLINRVYGWMGEKGAFQQIDSSIPTVIGTAAYALPYDIVHIVWVRYGATTMLDWMEGGEKQMRELYPDFDAGVASGTPVAATQRGRNALILYPPPDAVQTLGIMCHKSKADMSAAADQPEVPWHIRDAMVDAAAWMCCLSDVADEEMVAREGMLRGLAARAMKTMGLEAEYLSMVTGRDGMNQPSPPAPTGEVTNVSTANG